MKQVIQLVTSKGEDVLVNFKNVSYCSGTNNDLTSLRINYTHGKENLGAYLIVKETIEQIQSKLLRNVPIKRQRKDKS